MLLLPRKPGSARQSAIATAVMVLGLVACQKTKTHEPPGDGVPKACRDRVEFEEPMVTGIGLSSHLALGEDAAAEAKRDYEIGQWSELGVKLVRRDLSWRSIEPERGVFDFTLPDRMVDATDSVGGETLGLLVYGNDWATAGTDETNVPPDDPTDFANYAAAVADRYRGRIRHYEIWNEENAGIRFWKPVEDPVGYAELLVEAADRIHEVDPEAKVSLGGLFHPDLAFYTSGPVFLEAVFDAAPDLASHIDAVAFHPYRYPFDEPEERQTQESQTEAICGMYQLMEDRGAGELELWITEMGWHTAPVSFFAGVSEQDQATYLVRSVVLSLAQGVPVYSWYTFRDGGEDPANQEEMFGLYGYDEDPTSGPDAAAKRSAAAFSTMTAELGSHDTIEDLSVLLDLDETTYAYELSGDEQSVIVLWSTGEESAVEIPSGGEASLVDLVGEETPLLAQDGVVEVTVGPEPLYLVRSPSP